MIGSGGTVVLIGLSPAGEKAEGRFARAVRQAGAHLVSHGATICRRTISRALRNGRSKAARSRGHGQPAQRPLEGWEPRCQRCASGAWIRTVLLPERDLNGAKTTLSGCLFPGSTRNRADMTRKVLVLAIALAAQARWDGAFARHTMAPTLVGTDGPATRSRSPSQEDRQALKHGTYTL